MENGLNCHLFKVHWLLNVPPALTLRDYSLQPHYSNVFHLLLNTKQQHVFH
jgi:hypothetical protein